MNFGQLVAMLKRESGRIGLAPASPESSSPEDRSLWSWVATEWMTLQTSGVDWRFMRATGVFFTASGQSVYAPAQVGAPFSALWPSERDGYQPTVTSGPSSWYLEPELPYDVVNRMLAPSAQPGPPMYYALTPDGSLMLAPRPDRVAQVSIDVVKEPTALVAPADEPVGLPVRHRSILVWGALKRLAVEDAAGELLARANNEYQEAWNRLWIEQGPRLTLGL